MMNYMLFLNQLFATEVEWKDLSKDLKKTYRKIVTDDFDYEFVKATPVNDFWTALDIKAVDVVGGCLWMYEDEDFTFFDEDEDLYAYSTSGKNGFFEYFNNFTRFKKWLKGSLSNNETVEDVKRLVYKRPLPNVLKNAMNRVFEESAWNSQDIETYMNDVNINLDVFCVFEPKHNENFECQAQFFFKKSNGKTYVTNILKVKKENGQIYREGFGDESTINFNVQEPEVELTPEEIEVNRVTEAILQPGAPESDILMHEEQTRSDEPEQVVPESFEDQKEVGEPSEQQIANVSATSTEAHASSENPRISPANVEEVPVTTRETESISQQRTSGQQQEEEPIAQQELSSVSSESVAQEQAETVTSTVEALEEKKGMSGWLIALIVASCIVIAVLAIVFVRYMFADRK